MRTKSLSLQKCLLFLSLLLLLGACGNPSTPLPSPTAPEGSANEVPSTKVYKDFQGREKEIPAAPKRIVSVAGSGAAIDLLELGFEPAGYPYRYMENSSILTTTHARLSANAPDIGMPTNLEAVLELTPDLIVMGYETQDGEYEMLEKIAPVAAFDESLPFQERLTAIGEIVGKQEEAAAILADLDQRMEEMWNGLREQGKIKEGETAAVVVYYWNKKMYLMKNFGVFDLINHRSGLGMSDKVAQLAAASSSPYIEISEEVMHEALVADHLFMIYDHNEEAQEGFKQLKQSPVYQSLPQIKSGNVYYIPLEYNDSDVVTMRKLIEDFPKLLEQEPFQ